MVQLQLDGYRIYVLLTFYFLKKSEQVVIDIYVCSYVICKYNIRNVLITLLTKLKIGYNIKQWEYKKYVLL